MALLRSKQKAREQRLIEENETLKQHIDILTTLIVHNQDDATKERFEAKKERTEARLERLEARRDRLKANRNSQDNPTAEGIDEGIQAQDLDIDDANVFESGVGRKAPQTQPLDLSIQAQKSTEAGVHSSNSLERVMPTLEKLLPPHILEIIVSQTPKTTKTLPVLQATSTTVNDAVPLSKSPTAVQVENVAVAEPTTFKGSTIQTAKLFEDENVDDDDGDPNSAPEKEEAETPTNPTNERSKAHLGITKLIERNKKNRHPTSNHMTAEEREELAARNLAFLRSAYPDNYVAQNVSLDVVRHLTYPLIKQKWKPENIFSILNPENLPGRIKRKYGPRGGSGHYSIHPPETAKAKIAAGEELRRNNIVKSGVGTKKNWTDILPARDLKSRSSNPSVQYYPPTKKYRKRVKVIQSDRNLADSNGFMDVERDKSVSDAE